MKTRHQLAAICLLAAAAVPLAGDAADTGYRVISTIASSTVPAHALAVDAAARRLYAARDGAVDVYDIDAGRPLGSVALSGVPGGIEIVPGRRRGYVSVPTANTVTIFDLATLEVLGVHGTRSKGPREILHDGQTQQIYVSHAATGELVAMDALSGKRLAAVKLGGQLRQAATDGRGALFVADQSANVLHVVDARTLVAQGSLSVWPCESPSALANDTRERRIYVACGNSVMVIMDPDPGQMIGTVAVEGRGEPGLAMQLAPARLARLFVTTPAGGVLDVVQNAKLTATLERSAQVGAMSTAVAVDPKTGRVFIAVATGIAVVAK